MGRPSKLLKHAETIVSEYGAGVHGTVLAERYNVQQSAMYNFLKSQGVQIRARGGKTPKYESFNDQFLAMYREGKTIAQISEQLGVGNGTVQRAIAKYGKPRPNGTRQQTIHMPQDAAQIGYIAGLLDGEGNLQLKEDHESISCKLAIYNTCQEVIDWLHVTIGGNVQVQSREKKGWQTCYIWALYRAKDIYVLLKAVQPYLIIKREKCDMMLELLTAKLKNNPQVK